MAQPCKNGGRECTGCGYFQPERASCPHCGSDTYEYIVLYRANRDEVAYCSDCWQEGCLVREWRE